MTKNVNYKECTCDFCGKKEHIAQSLILPNQWAELKLKDLKYDLCMQCVTKMEQIIEDMRKGEEP